MTDHLSPPGGNEGDDKKTRRRRLRDLIGILRRQADLVCGSIQQANVLTQQVRDVVQSLRDLLERSDAKELLSAKVRMHLSEAADWLEGATKQPESMSDACNRAQKALRTADKALGGLFGGVAGPITAIVVFGISIAATVVLVNRATIVVENANCEGIELSGFADVIPGIDLPGEIPMGDQATVRVPRTLVSRFAINDGEVVMELFGTDILVPTGDVDLMASTWDDIPLVDFEGGHISMEGGYEHLLTLHCR